MIGAIMIMMSALFWQLDVRNRQLIEIGEHILSSGWIQNKLDEQINPVILSGEKAPKGFSFKQLFGAVFILGGLVGLAALGYAILLL